MARLKQILLGALLLAGWASAADRERKVTQQEEPEYSALAARLKLHGTVKVKIWITPEGKVRRLEYVGGHPLLAEAALKAVKNWRYEAASSESTTVVEVKF